MPPRDTDCPRCRGRLERGFLPDVGSQGQPAVGTWAQGEEPDKRWWGTTLKDRTRYRVEAWRCRECGRIELYGLDREE